MARKFIDVQPIITARFIGATSVTTEEAAREQVADTIAILGDDFECTVAFEYDARCEHCNGTWTEDGDAYNGGCCVEDRANDPERLSELKALAEDIGNADLFKLGVDHSATSTLPADLAQGVLTWLEAGRRPEPVVQLVKLAEEVQLFDWCTVWSDPGVYPSNAGASALPDQITADRRPDDLAHDLIELLDDMGLVSKPTPIAADEVVF